MKTFLMHIQSAATVAFRAIPATRSEDVTQPCDREMLW